MARVHGLQHVQGLRPAALTDHDALRPHAQRVDDQSLDADLALAVDVLGPRFQPADVLLVQLQLGRVFDGDDAILGRDEAGKHVQEGRFTGAGAARDDDVGLGQHTGLEEAEAGLVAGAEADQVFDLVGVLGELADGQQRTVDRERPDDGVDAGTVCQSGVGQRYALVDAAAHRTDDELDHVEKLVLVLELDVGQDHLAAHFHVNMVDAVDHDLGYAIVTDKRLDRPELGVVLV